MRFLFRACDLSVSFLMRNDLVVVGEGNRILMHPDSRWIRDCSFEIHGDFNQIVVGSRSKIQNTKFYFRGSHHVLSLGSNTFMAGGSFWFEDYGCRITIGRGTSIQNAHIAATEPQSSITLGEDCMLAYGIDVRSGDSHSIVHKASGERTNFAADVVLGNHVWIASHCKILKGVVIGENSVVGTGSVVTRDIPPDSLAAGTPARVKKSGITWTRERLPRNDVTPPEELRDLFWAWCDRGEALNRNGHVEEALVALDRAVALNPDDHRSRYSRGLARMKIHSFDGALEDFRRASRLRPDIAWYWFDQGKALQALGHRVEAVECFGRAVKIERDYPAAWYEKACCHAELGEMSQARSSLRRAIELEAREYEDRAREDSRLRSVFGLLSGLKGRESHGPV